MPKKWIMITFIRKRKTRHTFSRVLQPILAWGYNYKLTANSKAGFLSSATLDNAIAPFLTVEARSFHPCHNFVFKTVQYTITNMSNELFIRTLLNKHFIDRYRFWSSMKLKSNEIWVCIITKAFKYWNFSSWMLEIVA